MSAKEACKDRSLALRGFENFILSISNDDRQPDDFWIKTESALDIKYGVLSLMFGKEMAGKTAKNNPYQSMTEN